MSEIASITERQFAMIPPAILHAPLGTLDVYGEMDLAGAILSVDELERRLKGRRGLGLKKIQKALDWLNRHDLQGWLDEGQRQRREILGLPPLKKRA